MKTEKKFDQTKVAERCVNNTELPGDTAPARAENHDYGRSAWTEKPKQAKQEPKP